jgi:cytohesin
MPKASHEVTHLKCAAGLGDLATVQAILRKSPDAARDWRPILEASYKGYAPVVEALIKRGADVNAVSTSHQNRPLHRAVEQEQEEVIEVLLHAGADIDARGTWLQVTPLVWAAFKARPRIVELLVRRGAKIDRYSAAAIGKAAKAAQGVDTNSLTTLHYCAGSALSRPELVKIAARLVEAGADVNAKATKLSHNVTPIKLATHNRPVAELLLEHGADPNDVYPNVLLGGCTDFAFAGLLLARGADLNPQVWRDETLLHVAIHEGRLSTAKWLLERGADPNTVREKDAWTPLHQAASRGVSSIVTELLRHGADPAAKDRHGHTPRDVARAKKRAAVAALLS